MRKVLLTGSNGMLGTDFIKHFGNIFEIIAIDKHNGDITDINMMDTILKENTPDLILNFAAYTNVEDAEDIENKINFDVNTLGVYNLAKLSAQYNIDFITISTDYVFDGTQERGYSENDICAPINAYGMAKYLGEQLAKVENPNSIFVRTSWLYGGGKKFKNFVNTMLTLSETKKELKVVDDQFGSPTYTVDLCEALIKVIENIQNHRGNILHLCNQTVGNGISWFGFAQEIFRVFGKDIELIPVSSREFITKAKRPIFSKLINNSDVKLRDWKNCINDYSKSVNL